MEISKVENTRNKCGRKKGTKKTGGRKKGTPNKKTLNFLNDLGDFKPVEELLTIYYSTEKDDLKFSIIKEILKYVYPQRKAVDISVSEDTIETTQTAFLKHLKDLGRSAD